MPLLVIVAVCIILTGFGTGVLVWAIDNGMREVSTSIVLTSIGLLGLFIETMLEPRHSLRDYRDNEPNDGDPPSFRRWVRYLTGRERSATSRPRQHR